MQQLLASLVTTMSVRDAAFESGMKAASARAKKTEQDLERSTDNMGNAVERAADRINVAMVKASEAIASVGQKVARAGVALTAGITVPMALVGKKTKDTAADFESAMNAVQSAMLDASPEQLEKLADAAMKLGPAMGRSSIEAAGAIEMLAKNGMSAAAILNGGLSAALRLAVVGQTDLSGASDLTTDIMAQFGKTSSDLPGIVDKVSGALDASKMGFDDYRLAIGQAGGVAGGLGVSFDDLNVALASTASTFASGSDAGTSFKTFLMSLNPVSKEAAGVMKQLGIEFFDAAGKAKPLGEVAEILRQKLGNLSDKSRREALTTMFGSDGMRTAIALMNQGAAGIERYRVAIGKVTADQKISVLMEGDAAASDRMAAAAENLSIKLGQVLLPIFTAVKNAVADFLLWMADLPPAFHYAMAAVSAMTAMIGPLMVAVITLGKVALPLLLARFAVVPVVIGLIINPLTVLIGLIGRLAIQMGATAAIAVFAARMASAATGIGLVITILLVLVPLLNKKAAASKAASAASAAAAAADAQAAAMADKLAVAQGKARIEAIAKAKADRAKAHAAMMAAQADMQAARAAYARAKADGEAALLRNANNTRGAGGGTDPSVIANNAALARIQQAQAEFDTTLKTFSTTIGTKRNLDAMIANAEAFPTDIQNPTFGGEDAGKGKGKGSGPKGKTAEDRARDQAQYEDELGRLRVEALEARAELNGSIEARYDATMAAIAEDEARFGRSLALDDSLDDTKRKALMDAQKKVLAERALIAEQERSFALAKDSYDLEIARNDAMQEEVRAQIDAADSVAARRAGALRLLDLQRRNEEAVLDQIIATKKSTDIEYANAMIRKDQLDGIYADRRAAVERDNEGPMAAYRRELNRSTAAVRESIEAIEASGFERLNDWMADAIMGADNLAKAFGTMARSIVADLVRIVIQQQLIRPLADALGGGFLKGIFGGGGGSADLFGQGNGLHSFTPDLSGLSYAGGKASGGRVGPGNWYMVGEHGPEPFVPDTAGTIHPASSLRSGRGGTATIRIVEDEGFASRVVVFSGEVSVQTARAGSRRAVMRQRQKI